jgi:hypothetical protein
MPASAKQAPWIRTIYSRATSNIRLDPGVWPIEQVDKWILWMSEDVARRSHRNENREFQNNGWSHSILIVNMGWLHGRHGVGPRQRRHKEIICLTFYTIRYYTI